MFVRRTLAALTAAFCFILALPGNASAAGTAQPNTVNAAVASTTPNVLDGTVFSIAQVGNTIVLGGDFTGAANPGSQTRVTDVNRGRYVVAFDATTGQVRTAFAPNIDGQVRAVLPGPTAGTVYVGGYFNNVDGVRAKGLVLLDVATGQRVPGFATIVMNGVVTSLERSGNRLFVGGTFTTFAGQARGGLASVNATTGVVDDFMQSRVLTNHNWTEGSSDAKAAVGVFKLDITPDGSRMVVIGNFKTVDALPNDQIAMFDLTGAQATVRSDWRTRGYEARCYAWAYDTYVRDVQFSPDGSYFVVVTTGGGNTTLCDTAARYETNGSGDDVKPTWVDWSGGDSYLSVAVTGSTVYVGGHQRWMNNRLGNDAARGGAVPRPGLGALDPQTGIPLSWNPGRNPRGGGAYAMLANQNGLYVGSDTDYVGNFQWRRMKIAYFPLAGGAPVADTSTPQLPGTVYSGAPTGSEQASPVLFRVNAGGSALPPTDSGPAWASDTSSSSPYRNGGSNAASWGGISSDSTVPPGTPATIFSTERWDPGTAGDGAEMRWSFPVPAGTQVTVRLYFANQCSCTSAAGQRMFDVAIDDQAMLEDFDIVAAAGDRVGTMRHATLVSDGSVDISFGHVVENPLVNGIEIVDTVKAAEGTTDAPLIARDYDGSTVEPASAIASDLDWALVRAPVFIGQKLYYGKTNGMLYARTFDGTTFGPEAAVDPYNDPKWSDVDTGSNSTFRGALPSLYSYLPYLDAMFYSDGRLYFMSSFQSGLYYAPFSPESGIVGHTISQVPGVALGAVDGAFVSGGSLYYVQASTGDLLRRDWIPGTMAAPGTAGATVTTVSGPTTDGVDWRARSTFLGPDGPGVNQLPTAVMTSACTGLDCTFSASGSSDPDGTITQYAWDFGDGDTGAGLTETYSFPAAGTYPVTLTVTDNRGGTGMVTESVTVEVVANQPPVAEAAVSCDGLTCTFDATGSRDSDGSVASYAWSFGDGASGSGLTAEHAYATAGDYTATLTVTDDEGATTSRDISVSPTEPAAGGIGFRGVSGTNILGSSATVSVPDSVEAGDLLILSVAGAGGSAHTPPAGWTEVTRVAPTGVLTTVWQRAAVAGDAGDPVRVVFGASQKADVSLLAYSGAAAIDPSGAATATDAFSAGSHVQPAVTADRPGSLALWFWNVKSSATTDLSVPAGTVSRNFSPGSGTGRMTSLAAESAGPVSGNVPGPTSVANGVTTGRTTMVALVIPPSGTGGGGDPTPNEPPTAEAAASCEALTCSFDATGSVDGDGSVASYAWDFGDGAGGTGITASHTYAAAGDYVTTLTVTDNEGASATREITVSPAAPVAGAIAFRGVSGTSVLGTSATVTVPDSVEAGDLLILNVAGAGASSQTPPAGWSTVATVNPTGVLTTVFQRMAVTGDAGSDVRVVFGANQKADVTLLAYSGAAPIDPAVAATKTDPNSAGAHEMPDVVVTRPDSIVLWFWNVKSSATTDLTVPDGMVSRNFSAGSGTGYMTTLVAESTAVVTGTVEGPTSTADGVTTGRTTMVAVVIAPSA
ncbi:hypothetical protein GCM10010531_26760 [Blastococcus jejuensis]|uniref:PKD domain-containing protein n=1 Tax=Blastococcus jejuensis TaxID=351224 RepID=A0ABP6PBQ8_9ACTN